MSRMTEVFFKLPVDQTGEDGMLDKVNEVLYMMFGENSEVDWRDEHEVWVLHGDDHKAFLDGTWRITEL